MRTLLIIGFVLVSLSGTAQEWTPADKQKLREDCMKDASKALIPGAAADYCSCYVSRFLERFPVKTNNTPDTALAAISSKCIDEVKYRYPGGPFLDRWNESARASFVSGCKQKLKGVKVDGDAYCNCMLQKVMEVQPDPRLVKSIDPIVLDKIASECMGR